MLLLAFLLSCQADVLIPDSATVEKIKSYLPPNPTLPFGVPCWNRTIWDVKKNLIGRGIRNNADEFVQTPMPPFVDADYLLFSQTGDRKKGEKMMSERTSRLIPLALAECYHWNGTYANVLDNDLVDIANQKSWTFAAHDEELRYFNGREYFMDLNSADIASLLALIVRLLESQLKPETKSIVVSALQRRVFNPVIRSLQGSPVYKDERWIDANNNWNPICWAGVAVASLSTMNDLDSRALFLGSAFLNSKTYLTIFRPDGYYPESVQYFNGGFGHLSVLREAISLATQNELDLFQDSFTTKSGLFGLEFGMYYDSDNDTMVAEFGDSPFDTAIQANLISYLEFTLGISKLEENELVGRPTNRLSGILISYFSDMFTPVVIKGIRSNGIRDIRKYYDVSGVLVSRPNRAGTPLGIAASSKLGGNLGVHSHDDIGSYVISLNGVKLVGDGRV